MKKIIIIGSLIVIALTAQNLFAVNPARVDLVISCNRQLSVTAYWQNQTYVVKAPTLTLSGLDTAALVRVSTPIYVANDSLANSRAVEDFALSVTSNTTNAWTLLTSSTSVTGADEVRFAGVYKNTVGEGNTPPNADGANDVITTAVVTPTATQFAVDTDAASEKGYDIPQTGSTDLDRWLWITIETPYATSISDGEGFYFNITAQ